MKSIERMFYIAVAIGLFIKFPFLIGIAVMVGVLLLIILSTGSEEGE